MDTYSYTGPVMIFDLCITSWWEASTHAVSEKKARSNLVYQFKKKYNYGVNTKISLPGKIIKEES